MGDLHFSSDGVPILILGNHVLYGKAITLEKPYVLLTKLRTSFAFFSFSQKVVDDTGTVCSKLL